MFFGYSVVVDFGDRKRITIRENESQSTIFLNFAPKPEDRYVIGTSELAKFLFFFFVF